MNFRNLKPKLLAVAALALLSGGANAAVEYSGTPDVQPPLLKTYGVDVPTKSGLKSVLPQGWTLFIHKAVTLPEFMSWTVGAPWTKAVEDIDGHEKMVIRLDWSRKTVTIVPAETARPLASAAPALSTTTAPVVKSDVKPVQVTAVSVNPALATAASVAEKHQALVAPTLDPAKTAVAAVVAPVAAPVVTAPAIDTRPAVQVAQPSVPVQVAVSKPAVVASVPLIRSVPSTAQTAAVAAIAPVAPIAPVMAPAIAPVYRPVTPVAVAAPQVDANVARAQVGGSARDLVERMASRFNYVLSWEASDVTIPGAVTLLGVDIAEDAKLLQKAIGLSQTPVSIEVYRESSVIRVVPRSLRGQAVALVDGAYSGRIVSAPTARPQAAVQAPRLAVEPVRAPARVPSLESQPGRATPVATDPVVPAVSNIPVVVVTAPAKTRVIDSGTGEHLIALNIQKGDSLTNDLRDFFKGQGWELRWTANADLQASYPVTIQDTDVKKIMGKLLPKLGLTADFYNPSKLVVIRSTDSSTN